MQGLHRAGSYASFKTTDTSVSHVSLEMILLMEQVPGQIQNLE